MEPTPRSVQKVTENCHEQRVLIFAPTKGDACLASEFLREAGWESSIVQSAGALIEKIREGCCTVIIAEEALDRGALQSFLALLKEQPPWSDLPITLITTRGLADTDRSHRLAAFAANANVTLLERPFRPATLISTLEVARRARSKQY